LPIIDRYILRQIAIPAVLAAAVVTVVVLGGMVQKEVVEVLRDLPLARFSLSDIAELSVYALPSLASYIIPITYLLGLMMTFGRMARDSEITALKAAGLPLKRLVLPVIAMGALLSVLTFVVFDQGQPWAVKKFEQMRREMVLRMTIDMLPTGKMHHYGDWRVYIGGKDEDGRLREISILEPGEAGQATTFYAESAELVKEGGEMSLLLHSGHYVRPLSGDRMSRGDARGIRLEIPSLTHGRARSGHDGHTARALYQLQKQAAEELEKREADQVGTLQAAAMLRSYRMALGERLAFPLMCLAVSIAAAPIGVRTLRSGRSFTFASALIIVGAYFILRKQVQPPLGVELWQAILLAQVPNLVLCLLGAVLLWRVDRV